MCFLKSFIHSCLIIYQIIFCCSSEFAFLRSASHFQALQHCLRAIEEDNPLLPTTIDYTLVRFSSIGLPQYDNHVLELIIHITGRIFFTHLKGCKYDVVLLKSVKNVKDNRHSIITI